LTKHPGDQPATGESEIDRGEPVHSESLNPEDRALISVEPALASAHRADAMRATAAAKASALVDWATPLQGPRCMRLGSSIRMAISVKG
jgi:hypothetical protein